MIFLFPKVEVNKISSILDRSVNLIIELLKVELDKINLKSNLFENLQSKDGIYVYRINLGDKTAVMKYFEKEKYRREILCYKKLMNSSIDTIPIINQTDRCIVMEDMDSSENYRLGIKKDLQDEKVITALGKWYRKFHSVKLTEDERNNYYSEVGLLTKEKIEKTRKYDPENECFKFLELHWDKLINQHKKYEKCLNYNDFYYTNFIVSKDKSRAFMFDYNLMGVGYRYNDIRNVCSALNEEMRKTFMKEYGEFDLKEKIMDDWMSPLIALIYACQRDTFPNWGNESLDSLKDGSILKAMKLSLE